MYYIIGRYNKEIELFLKCSQMPIVTATFEEIIRDQGLEKGLGNIYHDPYRKCLEIARRKVKIPSVIEIITTFDEVAVDWPRSEGIYVSECLSFLQHDAIAETIPSSKFFTRLWAPERISIFPKLTNIPSIMFIPSVIAVRRMRSIFTKEERLQQTLKQGASINKTCGIRPMTFLLEMSREEDLTSHDVIRLRDVFDVVILGYKDVHECNHKSLSEAYYSLYFVKFARDIGATHLTKFGGRYELDGLPFYKIIHRDKPHLRVDHELKQACSEFYTIPKGYYDEYEAILEKLLRTVNQNDSSTYAIEHALYEMITDMDGYMNSYLYVRGYNALGAFSLL
jgi:hypothetical protein